MYSPMQLARMKTEKQGESKSDNDCDCTRVFLKSLAPQRLMNRLKKIGLFIVYYFLCKGGGKQAILLKSVHNYRENICAFSLVLLKLLC